MPDASLGLVMILKDEEANLSRSLAPVAGCFDEVVAVDTGSSDATAAKAAELGARVYPFKWAHDFSLARNYSISKAKADWLFWLDGDNAITPHDVEVLRRALPTGEPAILWALERVIPSGEQLWQKRCFPNRGEVRFAGRVHEQLVHPAAWPNLATPVVVKHWGYQDPAQVKSKGHYYLGLLEKSLQEDPEDFYSHYQIARCHLNLRQFAEATVHLAWVSADKNARRLNPDLWAQAHFLWSASLRRLGKHSQAVAILDHLLEELPDYGLAWFHRGRAAYMEEDWTCAVSHLNQGLKLGLASPVVDLDPHKTLFLAYYYLGLARGKSGQAWSAVAALAEAANLEPNNQAVRCDLAEWLMKLDREEEARRELQHVLQARPADRRAKALISQLETVA